ncbi:MAG: hypothetical protein ACK5M7_05520 [Draconibacterium sp.]
MMNQKNITDRKQLKSFFTRGSLPGQDAFEKLIDSTFNKADDKLDINEKGLMIYPSDNGENRLLSFFQDKDDPEATWGLFLTQKDKGGIYIHKIASFRDENEEDEPATPLQPAFYIQKDSYNIGLGTTTPEEKLDVKGIIASEGRTGNYLQGELKADGLWHNVFGDKMLNGANAFEIMAYVQGEKGEGKYSLLHAIAVSTYGNSKSKITKTSAHYGKWWNQIDIRWESRPSKLGEEQKRKSGLAGLWQTISSWFEARDPFRYSLQLKTRSNYGEDKNICFKVSVLWDERFTPNREKEQ